MPLPEPTLISRRGSFVNLLLLIITILFLSFSGAKADEYDFPYVPSSFYSNTQSVPIDNASYDYGGRVRLEFISGRLHRPRRDNDQVNYNYFFAGSGKLYITDTSQVVDYSGGGNRWSVREFTSAYLCGGDVPMLLNAPETGWHDDKIKGRLSHDLQFSMKAPDKFFGVYLPGEITSWLKAEPVHLPVWAELMLDDGTRVVIYLSPDLSEQLNIYRYEPKYENPFLVAGFNIEDAIITRLLDLDTAEIYIKLKTGDYFDASCRMKFSPQSDCRGFKLDLPSAFKVDSVIDALGNTLAFRKERFKSVLYIAPRQCAANNSFINIYYSGRLTGNYYDIPDYPINLTNWFPDVTHRDLATYIIHYDLHKDLTLLSVGDCIDKRIEGDRQIVTCASQTDIVYISFAWGVYDILSDSSNGVPLSLYVRKVNSQGLFNRDYPRKVLDDLTAAFGAFCDWFGRPVTENLTIVDQPQYSGQSSPGLIHIASVTFETARDQAHFRSHEVAHQWWGHTAIPFSSRESWLSEGLAEYSAAMFLMEIKHDTTAFRHLIDHWRRDILEEGRINWMYSRGYRAGPISLGMRLLESNSPGDYLALIYAKAAYLLRMLHFEVDGPAYRTDFFKAVLRNYCRENFDRKVTSKDFIVAAAKHIGRERATQFFNQWLYDWRVPSFECYYHIDTDERGMPLLNFSIKVADVGRDFSTPFPVEIEFEDGRRETYRVDKVGQKDEFTLGPFPDDIKKVRFDPDRIILATNIKVVER